MIHVSTSKKMELLDITDKVSALVPDGFSGVCTVFVHHATAAILINENWDDYLKDDVVDCLDKLIPQGVWKHDRIDNNGAAHIKAAMVGPSECIPVQNGELQLGRWQGIGLLELDGPRERKISVTFR